MHRYLRRRITFNEVGAYILSVGVLFFVLLSGCATTQESNGDGDASSDASAATARAERSGLRLATPDEAIQTIQLYAGGNERQLPVLSLRNPGQGLTLEFDLMESTGRPLTVYFYHADREWERDLSPAEYMDSFQDDNLITYTPSRGTTVNYTHYTYQFPNDDIQFRVSGNYILRVTEQGRRNEVLFERPFFITEDGGSIAMRIDNVPVSGQQRPSDLPSAQFTPPPDLRGNPFQYETCFVRNGRFATARCSDRPRLASQPTLEFDLYRRRAFTPTTADYYLDLSALQTGGPIAGTDRTVTPYRVRLQPDYAQFPGNIASGPPLDGQIVIEGAVRGFGEPDVEAEYVTTWFSFVPPGEQPLGRDVYLEGTFSGSTRLSWEAARARYEGELLLKQGLYEYSYASNDPALQEALRRTLPPARDRYTAFIYFTDRTLNTDRLIAVQTVQAP